MVANFEWDGTKAVANLAKHGVAFEDAARIFLDPHCLFELNLFDEEEQRWQATGLVNETLLLVVIHVIREHGSGETIRIISARKAERSERRRYDAENGSVFPRS